MSTINEKKAEKYFPNLLLEFLHRFYPRYCRLSGPARQNLRAPIELQQINSQRRSIHGLGSGQEGRVSIQEKVIAGDVFSLHVWPPCLLIFWSTIRSGRKKKLKKTFMCASVEG